MKIVAVLVALGAGVFAQAPASKSVLGTISVMRPETAEIEVKPENGAAITLKVSSATPAKKVAPGQTDLSKAETINITDIAVGDRVLVTLGADPGEVRRIIVIPANDLAKRDVADRQDWQRRGVAGVVGAITATDVTVEVRSLGGVTKYTVTAGPKTSFVRYAPDSVKFSDAKKSSLSEISLGDQIRARGEKSADGMKVAADDIVFGTFLSKAGTITAVNAASNELTIKDLSNNKPLTVKFTADSHVKRMTAMGGMPGMGGRGGGRGPGNGGPAPAAAGAGRGPGPGAGGQRGPDIAQILETLPPIKLDDLKPGEIVVISAIRGAKPDQITAITFVANAEELVKMTASPTGPAPSLAGLAGSIGSVGP